MNYYIADTHFGHENVLKFDNRPFLSVDEMDEILIAQWNAVVKDTDDIYIIGDFIYRAEKPYTWYLNQLKGRKHLIQGNHDGNLLKDEAAKEYFVSIDKMTYVKDGDYTIVLCHFPIAEWNKYWRGSWHIYGHIHNQKKGCFQFMSGEDRTLNAGCMINNYTPVTIEQLIQNNRFYQENYLWELCGNHNEPVELDDGRWVLPSIDVLNGTAYLETGGINYIMSEYCRDGLTYHFTVDGKRDHEHAFSAVLHAAYESCGNFKIEKADRHEYSEQELMFLKHLVEKIRKDKKNV